MAFKEWCDKHRAITWSVLIVGLVVVISSIIYQVAGQRRGIMTKPPGMYFSVDDGKTFFAAAGDNIPPFDFHGQTAVEADVFECGGKRFVGYLERYTPAAHQAMVENRATVEMKIKGRELKKPGDTKWVSSGNFKAAAMVADVHCPDGTPGDPVPVEP